jgi:CRISPR/Cas system-associated exonuclease Cas4 (RecB family)
MSQVSPVDIEGIYKDYISKKNEENKQERYIGKEEYYHASSTGSCSRKIWFESIQKAVPTNEPDKRSQRLLRLGTIVHDDIQNALLQYNVTIHSNKEKENNIKEKEIEFLVEKEIILPSLNVRGFYDLVALVSEEVYLFDFKTMASYTWSRKFGHNKDPNPSRLHEMQLGTYGLAVKEKFGRLDGMYLCYYKKDDSRLKTVPVAMNYLGIAETYWRDINREHKLGIPMFKEGISPAYPWMCNYCQFKDLCSPITT